MLNNLKSMAFKILVISGFEHPKAKREGYKNGWDMLIDRHDDNAAAIFYMMIGSVLSPKQVKVLFDGIIQEYTEYPNFEAYLDVVAPIKIK